MKSFKEIGVEKILIDTISKIGFEQPMPIQEKVLPHLLQDSHPDIIAHLGQGCGGRNCSCRFKHQHRGAHNYWWGIYGG